MFVVPRTSPAEVPVVGIVTWPAGFKVMMVVSKVGDVMLLTVAMSSLVDEFSNINRAMLSPDLPLPRPIAFVLSELVANKNADVSYNIIMQ